MNLFRYGNKGNEKPGLLINDKRYDVSKFIKDFDRKFFAEGGINQLKNVINNHFNELNTVAEDVRIGPALKDPGHILCIGMNYKKHAEETGKSLPPEPVIFTKAPSALNGPFDNLVIPKNSHKTDYEVELAVVIGKKANYVTEKDAMDYVAGFVLHNDYSEREFQAERKGQWVKGKSADTFAPLGPFIVTPDEIKDPHNLRLWLKVNDQIRQDSNTSDMVFKIPQLISYISQFMSLMPGDIISTGTPKGVALGMNPPQFIQEDDVLEWGIDGLGSAKQTAKAYAPETAG